MTYENLDEVLKLINKSYVSLDTEHVRHNNKILILTLWKIIEELQTDPLFDKLFERPYFGGSFYDDLKVGKPDEFDLDLLLVLPKACEIHKNNNSKTCGCIKVTPSNQPGFFWFKIEKGFCADLDKEFIKDGYFQTDLVLNWLKGKINIALNHLIKMDPDITSGEAVYDAPKYFSESGPALTLKLDGSFGHFDIDLVPAFKFGAEYWPENGYLSNQTNRDEFFIVPKKAKGIDHSERFWRASFQDQERELIKGKERLKPALRLLKKMRSNLKHTISSYALKSMVLCNLDIDWHESLADVFMILLEFYKDSLSKKEICYYWNEGNNLLNGIHQDTLENHHNEIAKLLKEIKEKHTTDPCIVAKVILKKNSQEYIEFMDEYENQNRLSTSFTSSANWLELHSDNNASYEAPSLEDRLGHTSLETADSSANGWKWAGIAMGVGAIAAVGFSVFGARSNRNQNR